MDKIVNPPTVSVVMSVYNGAEYLRPAIDSILDQTFKDFEFIIINDGSTDGSLDILHSYHDPRLVLISRPNKGLTASLNEGFGKARGTYIARQDADDISELSRLEKEVNFLEKNPSVGLVGSNYVHIDESGKKTGAETHIFTHPSDLKACLVLCNQFGHGSIMLRTECLKLVGGYDPAVGHAEDYDLWVRISQLAKVANIEEPLYLYRNLSTSISHSKLEEQVKLTFMIRDKAFKHYLSHKREYKPFGIHIGGKDYWLRKSTMYRDYAYLAIGQGRNMLALQFMLAALIAQPFLKHNYRCLVMVLYKPRRDRWKFEFL
jgi:glycosyltransferase involved in cell wall biosynthesis